MAAGAPGNPLRRAPEHTLRGGTRSTPRPHWWLVMTLMNRLAERRGDGTGSDDGKAAKPGLKVMAPARGDQNRPQVLAPEPAAQVDAKRAPQVMTEAKAAIHKLLV